MIIARLGALALVLSLGACSSTLVPLPGGGTQVEPTIFGIAFSFGNKKVNAAVANAAAKLDANITVAVSDVPALCSILTNGVAVAAAVSTTAAASGSTSIASVAGKAANDANAVATSPLCPNGLTGTLSDATTIASAIQALASATKMSVTALASTKSGN